ncbi:MAG: redoxin domain-containing protein [Chitinophagales bacterium]|nr:redoxin domain-containing protein [Chitinophagales bacterium]
MAVIVGQKAPDFTLYDSDKNEVSLSGLKGNNVLLLFYPLAFTGTCTKELCSVRDNIATYNNANATVLGISIDNVFVQDRFKKEHGLQFPLLSDFNKETIHAYDIVHDTFAFGMKEVGKRSAFVVDKEGFVKYAEVLDNPSEIPDFEAINACLAELH